MKEMQHFGDILLSKKVLSALHDMGFEEPSPIQTQTIPIVTEGKDAIGQAQTGTGKTAAFGIPIVERITDHKHPQALILTPTRELAIQVAEEITKIGKYKRIRTLAVYGGQPIDRQIRALKMGVQVVVGTPGRLIDHLNRRTINFSRVNTVVLDEADEMLDMGFVEDIQFILGQVPTERQTLLFSATMPPEIRRLAERYMRDPVTVAISREKLTVPLIEQYYYELRLAEKVDGLCRVVDSEEIQGAIVFCRTKKSVDELVAALQMRGYQADGLHGDLSQSQRDRVMKKFRDGKIDLLVATDVAARGLDIDHVSHVINYDVPQDPESYVHRIGRTGRAGRKGIAMTFIEPREYKQLKLIEHLVKTKIQRRDLPTGADVFERQRDSLKHKVVTIINNDKLSLYKSLAEELLDEQETLNLIAALLKLSQEGFCEDEDTGVAEVIQTGAKSGMVRLFINIGRLQNIRPEDIVRAISEEADVPVRSIGNIRLYDNFTFVEVPHDVYERVLSVMQKNVIKGKRINVELAKGKR